MWSRRMGGGGWEGWQGEMWSYRQREKKIWGLGVCTPPHPQQKNLAGIRREWNRARSGSGLEPAVPVRLPLPSAPRVVA